MLSSNRKPGDASGGHAGIVARIAHQIRSTEALPHEAPPLDVSGSGRGRSLRALLLRYERSAIALLILVGLIARGIWVSQDGRLRPVVSETQQVVSCFARTGSLCDAYFVGQGPTAHVNPVIPVVAGYAYRAFGEGSLTTEVLLTALSLTFLCVTLLALYFAFRRLGVAVEWRLAALAAATILPMNFRWDTISMRLFEGGLSAALLAVSLLLVLRLDAKDVRLRPRDYVLSAVLVGFLALINPPAALGAYGALGILTLKRAPVRQWPGVALVMVAGLAIFIAPWGLRNEQVFGRPILSRSNFPLEHALGFHQAAVAPQDPAAVFRVRAHAIHPYSDDPAAPGKLRVMRIGELAYMDQLAAETRAWERTHRLETVLIAARHLGEFWLPPSWSWRLHGPETSPVAPRQAFVWATTLAAFAAVVWRLVQAPLGQGLYLASVLIIPSLPYALVQPIQRYRYLIAVLVLFLAADFVGRVFALRRRAIRVAEPAPRDGLG